MVTSLARSKRLLSVCAWLFTIHLTVAADVTDATDSGESLQVLSGPDARHMMQYYYEAIAQEQAKTWPKPKTLAESLIQR